MITVWG